MMRTLTALALATAIALPSAGFAAAEVNLTDQVKSDITAKLTDEGYEVVRVATEDGMYEVYAKKDGARMEVYLDGDLNIVTVKD